MRLVIDLQAAQAGHSTRGIGKYALSLVHGLLRNASVETEIHIALNGAFSESVERIRRNLSQLLAQEHIHVWYPLSSGASDGDQAWRDTASEIVCEAFLNHLNPDVIVITSLFEGFHDAAATSFANLRSKTPVAVVLYDLIPIAMEDSYLQNETFRKWYVDKLDQLSRADMHLCISHATRCESIERLGTDHRSAVNISAAIDEQFRPIEVNAERESACRMRTSVTGDFVLYTGGIDPRKNIDGLIRAFAALPSELQESLQLVVVCAIQEPERLRLNALAKKHDLAKGVLQLTGYVSNEDLHTLYNLCKVFVFPSLMEGFGLPALEAMQCGCPVIASNCSSLPEVVGLEDALFDPKDENAITALMAKVLSDNAFRDKLVAHGLEQAAMFSWDKTAMTTLTALSELASLNTAAQTQPAVEESDTTTLPRLAFVSPMPPERSGIADYSAELLPSLAKYYRIDVVTNQSEIAGGWIKNHCDFINSDAFAQTADSYDRILYHFGNSTFHEHMFGLLESYPGTVVLHDAYLSGILAHMEHHGVTPGAWVDSLYRSHGYASVAERFSASDTSSVVWKYPCNIDVIRRAVGVIVHSHEPVRQTIKFYGKGAADHFSVIPLLRSPVKSSNKLKAQARKTLGVPDDQILVCSFGLLGPTKLNHRLLDAWTGLQQEVDCDCALVFVGENHEGPYGQRMTAEVKRRAAHDQVHITGWADKETYELYLQAADVGVQLRTLSRGETSAAILDCMKYGLATIVNKNGSMNDLPDGAVQKIPDNFSNSDLTAALQSLIENPTERAELGNAASNEIALRHSPENCSKRYAEAIEIFYDSKLAVENAAISEITRITGTDPTDSDFLHAAIAMDRSLTETVHLPTLFVDVSELVNRDAGTGIQRVVKSVLESWLANPPIHYRVEPVYASADAPGYRYARKFTLDFLGVADRWLADEPISYRAGDHFIGLDLQPHVVPVQRNYLHRMRRHGVSIQFVVYDLLPIALPDCFVEGGADMLEQWLDVIAGFDGAVCISEAVAEELRMWLVQQDALRDNFQISWFHLGAAAPANAHRKRIPRQVKKPDQPLRFLMVGTLEPRKGHARVLSVFEQLWSDGLPVVLTIVGKKGWMVDELTETLRRHSEQGTRLFWEESTDDSRLQAIYQESDCLIAASRGEGFGLPLVEAAQFGLPIIARDIPVFREVAGEAVWYFDEEHGRSLKDSLREWITLYRQERHPRSEEIPWLTWEESSGVLLQRVLDGGVCLDSEPVRSSAQNRQ